MGMLSDCRVELFRIFIFICLFVFILSSILLVLASFGAIQLKLLEPLQIVNRRPKLE